MFLVKEYYAKKHEFTKEPFTPHLSYTSDVEEHRTKTDHYQTSYHSSRLLQQRTSRLKFREGRYPFYLRSLWYDDYNLTVSDLLQIRTRPFFPLYPCFSSFSYPIFHPIAFTMKSNLSFSVYIVAFLASHASCAPQQTFDDSFYVSSGQTCDVAGGIVRVLPNKKLH